MANKDSVPGRHQDGQCATYAQALQKKLPFKTTLVTWTVTGIDPFARSARHQVLSWTTNHEVWMIDNDAIPKWVGMEGERWGVSALQFYAGNWVVISNIAIDGKPNPPETF